MSEQVIGVKGVDWEKVGQDTRQILRRLAAGQEAKDIDNITASFAATILLKAQGWPELPLKDCAHAALDVTETFVWSGGVL